MLGCWQFAEHGLLMDVQREDLADVCELDYLLAIEGLLVPGGIAGLWRWLRYMKCGPCSPALASGRVCFREEAVRPIMSQRYLTSRALVSWRGVVMESANGVFVGKDMRDASDVFFTRDMLSRHALISGVSGMGKTVFLRNLAVGFLELKARGECDGSVVVLDAFGDLLPALAADVPADLRDVMRVLDFGGDPLPELNLLDPKLYFDRDWCAGVLTYALRGVLPNWGARLEDSVSFGVKALYDYNAHRDTPRDSMLTVLDLLPLFEPAGAPGETSELQRRVMERVSDPMLLRWFDALWGWSLGLRREAFGALSARLDVGSWGGRGAAVLGQGVSSDSLSDLFGADAVVLVSLGSGRLGRAVQCVLSGALMGMYWGALQQRHWRGLERSQSVLFADGIGDMPGASWDRLLEESRKFGCSAVLSTQTLEGLGGVDVLSNAGCLVSFRSSLLDASTLSRSLGGSLADDLLQMAPGCAYVRLMDGHRVYPVFSLRVDSAAEGNG